MTPDCILLATQWAHLPDPRPIMCCGGWSLRVWDLRLGSFLCDGR